jgi:uncharacterized protein YbcI
MTDDPRQHRPAPEAPGEVLSGPDHTGGVDVGKPGGLRLEIANVVVGLKKQFYGRGPTKARVFLNDNYVFCVMEGGLTRNEETLLDAEQDDVVRSYRLKFQEVMAKTTTEAIEPVTGRRVLGYHSQIVFRPDRTFEIFVLDAPPGSP